MRLAIVKIIRRSVGATWTAAAVCSLLVCLTCLCVWARTSDGNIHATGWGTPSWDRPYLVVGSFVGYLSVSYTTDVRDKPAEGSSLAQVIAFQRSSKSVVVFVRWWLVAALFIVMPLVWAFGAVRKKWPRTGVLPHLRLRPASDPRLLPRVRCRGGSGEDRRITRRWTDHGGGILPL